MTPAGVRDGDPYALVGLCDRRGPAVLAYCEIVAGRGERGAAAAADAFGSFRAGVVATADLTGLNPESLLVSATRHAAARHAAADVPGQCARVPVLLAARADRSITLADHDWLQEHLATCWACRAPVARFEAADRAYREPPATPLAAELMNRIVEAMTAAAPVRGNTDETPRVQTNGATAATADAPAPSTNGQAPRPTHDVPVDLPPHPADPQTEYDMPAVDASAQLDQPTSAYQIPAPQLDVPEPPSVEHPARSGRRAGVLGAVGLGKPRRAGRGAGRPQPARATAATSSTSEAGYGGATAAIPPTYADDAATQTGATRLRRVPRGDRAGRAAPATLATDDRMPSGTSLPRPRRATARTSSRRRSRGSLRPAVVLPIALVVIAIIAALLIAGVFGGGSDPASSSQSFAPSSSDETTPAQTSKPRVVVVSGAKTASAAAVERAKARTRAAKRTAAEAKKAAANATATTPPPAVAPTTAANPAPPPPAATPPQDTAATTGKPKIDADKGATGAEQLPPAKDTSTVPDLAPPVVPAAPPG